MADNRATLKTFFETGDIPIQAQFAALIDGLMSVVDSDTVTGIKTFNSNIILADTRVLKALSGGGELNLRAANIDGFVSLTPDNTQFKQSFYFGTPVLARVGFGDPATQGVALIDCEDKSIKFTIRGKDGEPNTFTTPMAMRNNLSGTQVVIGFFDSLPVAQPVAIPDTSGATLSQLEDEVNKVKAAIRSLGLIAP